MSSPVLLCSCLFAFPCFVPSIWTKNTHRHIDPTKSHLLEPAGEPQGIMKVGCGHECNIAWFGLGPIKSLLDTPHVAIGYRSIRLAFARLFGAHIRFFSSFCSFLLSFPPFDTSITFTDYTFMCIGCHCPCQRHHRFPAGEEAHPREEGPHPSRQAQPQPLGPRLGFLFAVYCDLCCRFSILCTCRFMPPTTSNICAPRLEPSSVRMVV